MRDRHSLVALATSLLAPAVLHASPVACDAGSIDFDARSNDPALVLTTFNVGQLVTLSALPAGIAPSAFDWVIDGPHIKDYDERVGTTATGPMPITWSTTALAAADLAAPSVSFYWKPSPSQINPLNGGAVTRNVTLNVTVGASVCTVSQTFSVERNNADITKQAEDFYTRNHRDPAEPDVTKGRPLDDHMEWHFVPASRILAFLPWHREFIARFNTWRAEFGYPRTLTWYPGNPIPTGVEIDDTTRGTMPFPNSTQPPFDPNLNHIPTWFTLAGGAQGTGGGSIKRLADFATLADFSNALEGSWHGQVHCNVGGIMCTMQSPRDPIFYRWHGMIDRLYENFCSVKGLGCASTPMPPSDLWMADNAADLAANGVEPSSGAMWASPSVWNRNTAAACTPADPLPEVPRTCGSAADHENPIAGVTNYLYATIRNDRPGAVEIKYAEVAAYIANASTGLIWPASFGGDPDGALPETRQFITVNLPPGGVTDVGPVLWVPPPPVPSDHWCMYVRALSEQAPIVGEVAGVVLYNALASNNVVYRNLTIVVNSTDSATFTFANDRKSAAKPTLRIEVPDAFLSTGAVRLLVPPAIAAKWRSANLAGIKDAGIERSDPAKMRELIAAMPAIDGNPREGASARERELLRRVVALKAAVRACAMDGRASSDVAKAAPIPETGRIDPKRERVLLDAIRLLERQQRACARQAGALAAFTVTAPRASIAGVTLKGSEKYPVTIEFSNDAPGLAEHFVNVIQETPEGKTIGGNTYVVRTGSH